LVADHERQTKISVLGEPIALVLAAQRQEDLVLQPGVVVVVGQGEDAVVRY
jgi:hypothetical protein